MSSPVVSNRFLPVTPFDNGITPFNGKVPVPVGLLRDFPAEGDLKVFHGAKGLTEVSTRRSGIPVVLRVPLLRAGVFGNFAAGFRSLVQNFQQRPVAATVAGLSPLLLGAQEAFAAEPQPLLNNQGLSQILFFAIGGAILWALAANARREKAATQQKTQAVSNHPSFEEQLYSKRLNSFADYLHWISRCEMEDNFGLHIGMWRLASSGDKIHNNTDWYIQKYLVEQGHELSENQACYLMGCIARIEDALHYTPRNMSYQYTAQDLEKALADERQQHEAILAASQYYDISKQECAQLMIYAVDIFKAAYDRDLKNHSRDLQ